jgi:hypothetical protein
MGELPSRFEHDEFENLTEAQRLWAEEFELSNNANRDREQMGVVGVGRSTIDPEAITVFVTPVTDEEHFPREVEGAKVIYRQTSYPRLYDN